jgi:hypothetical protein
VLAELIGRSTRIAANRSRAAQEKVFALQQDNVGDFVSCGNQLMGRAVCKIESIDACRRSGIDRFEIGGYCERALRT